MDNNIFNEIGTTLDLNGPILSYSEQPTGATGIGTTINSTGGGSVSFTGIATGVDPGTGYISYEWYEQDVGKLSDSTYVTGTASTGPVGTAATLTISIKGLTVAVAIPEVNGSFHALPVDFPVPYADAT